MRQTRGLFLALTATAATALVLWQAISQRLEWLAVVALIILVAIMLPNFLVGLIERLRPWRAGPVAFEARSPQIPEDLPPDRWRDAVREETQRQIEELRRDPNFLFLSEVDQRVLAELRALGVRLTALEEKVVSEQRLRIGGA